MKERQRAFVKLALECGALRFGEFELKSGRQSPYFFNAGTFCTGARLAALARLYARTIVEEAPEFDLLFGPAYKGIPLVAAVSVALAEHHDRDLPWAFNRKEAKDHGEGGNLVGAPVQGRVLIIDDVITAGTAVREAVDILRDRGARPGGLIVALDRQERGTDGYSAVEAVEHGLDIPVRSIATLDDIIDYLAETGQRDQQSVLQGYRREHGT